MNGWCLPIATVWSLHFACAVAGRDLSATSHRTALSAAAFSGESIKIIGTVERLAGRPAELIAADGSRHRLAGFSSIEWNVADAVLESEDWPTQLHFGDQEVVFAKNVVVDRSHVYAQTPIGELRCSRDQVDEILCLRARKTVSYERFSRFPTTWRPARDPKISATRWFSPPSSLLLNSNGQRLEHVLLPPLATGRFSMRYYDEGGVRRDAGKWSVVFVFGITGDATTCRVTPGFDRPVVTAVVEEKSGMKALAIPRRTGWHELEAVFDKGRLHVTIDGANLLDSPPSTALPSLSELRIEIGELPEESVRPPAQLWIDDVSVVSEDFPPRQRLLTDPFQADLLDHNGDQWFGEVVEANERTVDLRTGKDRTTSFNWADVVSLRFPVRPQREWRWAGEIGRLELVGGGRLIGSLEIASHERWIVRHPALGELTIAADRLRRWSPLTVGGRIAWDRRQLTATRIGDTPTIRSFVLDHPVAEANLCLTVSGLESHDGRAPFAALLNQGGLRAEVWLNGTRIDDLNRHIRTWEMEPVSFCVSLPAAMLVVGKNQVEIRRRPDVATGLIDEFEISAMAVEWSHAESPSAQEHRKDTP